MLPKSFLGLQLRIEDQKGAQGGGQKKPYE